MDYKSIKHIKLEDIYWLIKVGKSTQKLNVYDLRSNLNEYIKNPVFFLSTGRCGTMWFSNLLKTSRSNMVLHSPQPSFATQNRLIYSLLKDGASDVTQAQLIKEIFFAGREQYLRYAYKTKKRYIETNNYITFFAPILIQLFPDAKFVHLYRHPAEFIRSGMRRNYYTENNTADIKRIVPDTQDSNWLKMSRIEKTAWLWNQTNQYIEDFKKNHQNNCFSFNFNNLEVQPIKKLFADIEVKIQDSEIQKQLKVKTNTQQTGNFPTYNNWTEKQKSSIKTYCEKLAISYGYSL